jgi:hypothetical protein
MVSIKRFNEIKLNEEDDFDVEELKDDNEKYLKTKYTYQIQSLEKVLDRCLHDIDKTRLKDYINVYINKSIIKIKPSGWGFYGADTED